MHSPIELMRLIGGMLLPSWLFARWIMKMIERSSVYGGYVNISRDALEGVDVLEVILGDLAEQYRKDWEC